MEAAFVKSTKSNKCEKCGKKKHHRCHEKSASCEHDDDDNEHAMQLQLLDSLGFAVENTQFWVNVIVTPNKSLVTVNIPAITFQTGQVSSGNVFAPTGEITAGIPPAGGYLTTVAGFLPEKYRPNDTMPQSIVAASNNGFCQVFSFTQDPATLPTPPSGYIV